jgi:hypothetical protein
VIDHAPTFRQFYYRFLTARAACADVYKNECRVIPAMPVCPK